MCGKPYRGFESHSLRQHLIPGIPKTCPAGGKLWRFRYEVDGREKLLLLGSYPLVGLAQARAAVANPA
ncbi:Arm DNA-binding domain-containing protein [Bradyrhizobium sp. USDA 4353]